MDDGKATWRLGLIARLQALGFGAARLCTITEQRPLAIPSSGQLPEIDMGLTPTSALEDTTRVWASQWPLLPSLASGPGGWHHAHLVSQLLKGILVRSGGARLCPESAIQSPPSE